MDSRTKTATLAIVSAVCALVSACGGSGDDATPTPLVGEIHPPTYGEALPISTGEPPVLDRTWAPVRTRGPVFSGEINGFRLHRPGDSENSVQSCGGTPYVGFEEVEVFTLNYIPEGSYAFGPQTAAICQDGSMAAAYWDVRPFQVSYVPGECAFANTVPEGAIIETIINDSPALVISQQGIDDVHFIDTKVAFLTDRGCVFVDARGMPVATAVQIVEAIDCPDC